MGRNKNKYTLSREELVDMLKNEREFEINTMVMSLSKLERVVLPASIISGCRQWQELSQIIKTLKKLLTSLRPITVHKESLLAKASHHFAITHMLQENMCRMGQEVVCFKASELIELLGQIQVIAKQIDRVCNYYGEQIH